MVQEASQCWTVFEHCSSAPRSVKGSQISCVLFSQRSMLDGVSLFRYFCVRGSCFHFVCSSRKGEVLCLF